MAAQFCAKWLLNNKKENDKVQKVILDKTVGEGTSSENEDHVPEPTDPTEISYENDDFQLIVKSAPVKRARKFKLEDHQFTLLIRPKKSITEPPLVEILQFLEDGFKAILSQIKKFFNPKEHRIAYLTLYQQPMVYIV